MFWCQWPKDYAFRKPHLEEKIQQAPHHGNSPNKCKYWGVDTLTDAPSEDNWSGVAWTETWGELSFLEKQEKREEIPGRMNSKVWKNIEDP